MRDTRLIRSVAWTCKHWNRIVFVLAVAAIATILLSLLGCAAGRNEATGEIVVGLGVARLTETTNQAISQLGDYFLPGMGGTIGIIGASVIGWARARSRAAQLQGQTEGWDQRGREVIDSPDGPVAVRNNDPAPDRAIATPAQEPAAT